MDRATRTLTHRVFRDIGDYLCPGDLLVANDSRVLPARLFAHKLPTRGKVELLLLKRRDPRTWEALVHGRKTPIGTRLALSGPDDDTGPIVTGEITEWTTSGARVICWERPIDSLLDDLGIVPLPPYVRAPIADPERYQTVYARHPGSVAAPTAGLHFTPELLIALRRQGVQMAFVDLDIGLDTFRPVETERIEDHQIHTERCSLSAETARQINQARLKGRRLIAVGTTSVRVLETAAQPVTCTPDGREGDSRACAWQTVRAFDGPTDLFIYPGFAFRAVDALITNFHLPRSSLLMLVSAFADRDLILTAYQEAVREGYRFYSFGDAMLIL